jgi:hypothetical protein
VTALKEIPLCNVGIWRRYQLSGESRQISGQQTKADPYRFVFGSYPLLSDKDPTTRKLREEIPKVEEEHGDDLKNLLARMA